MSNFYRIFFLVLGSLFSLSFFASGILMLYVMEGWQKLSFLPQFGFGAIFLKYFIEKYGKKNQESSANAK